MSEHIIRGEGTIAHSLGMARQIIKVLLGIILIITLGSVYYSFSTKTNKLDWKNVLAYTKANIYLHDKNKKIAYTNVKGKHLMASVGSILVDPLIRIPVIKIHGVFINSLYLSVKLSLFSIILTVTYFYRRGLGLKKAKKLRGIFLTTKRQLLSSVRKHNKKFSYKPFIIADFPYPILGASNSFTAGEQAHTLILGSTGSGKTRILFSLIKQLRDRNQKAIIVDIKGDYIRYFYDEYKGDIILNPLDMRGRNWSIFSETTPIKGFNTIARSLLPKESRSDPIWIDAARAVVAEMANLYVNANLSMSEFADKILKLELSILVELLKKTGASKIINQDIEKAALSVLMTLTTYLRPFKLYRNKDNLFSITDWVNNCFENNFLFISSKADLKEDLNPLISTQVSIASLAIRSSREESMTPKIWFILDELPYFEQPIAGLMDSLATARSVGGCFILGSQDMSSLSKIYGRENSHSIANNCRTKIYMNIGGFETAEWCSSSIGEGEIEEWTESISYGNGINNKNTIQANRQKSIVRTVTPSELMMIKTGSGFISLSGYEPAKFKFKSSSFTQKAEPYVENVALYEQFKFDIKEAENRRKQIEDKLGRNSLESQNELIISLGNKKSKLLKDKIDEQYSFININDINNIPSKTGSEEFEPINRVNLKQRCEEDY